MSIAIGEDHRALGDAVRRFVTDRCPPSVVRAAVDGELPARPPFWTELARPGWLGLHLPEEVGGQGCGLSETAIVVEELGRAAAPGPFLPTVWAGAVLQAGGGPLQVLGALARGEACGAVALGRPLHGRGQRRRVGGGIG